MSLPSPQIKARPRGKTFGKQLELIPKPISSNANNNGSNDLNHDHTVSKKLVPSDTDNAGIQTNKRAIHRQAQLFASLDEAENLTLELLSLASSTAQELANGTDAARPNSWMEKGSNGKKYLEKINQIHQLLSPHSHLVVAYRNHSVDTDAFGSTNTTKKPTSTTSDSSATKQSPNQNNGNSGNKNNNMYAARVELRLAMERREVLRELLKSEQLAAFPGSGDDNLIPSAMKRKRE